MKPFVPPDFYDDLELSFAQAWQLWVRGGKDRKSPFHTPVVATLGADGPEVRVMVLRQADKEMRMLRFHTDIRSGKIAELAAHSAISILGYDSGSRIQLRVRGTGRIERDTLNTDLAWERTSLSSRKCYLAHEFPGAHVAEPSSGLAPIWTVRDPTPEESHAGRPQFAILMVDVVEIEWVFLASPGHRRAQFRWIGEAWRKNWLVP
jgi:pyridoxamine 5'-phosphate oxidase